MLHSVLQFNYGSVQAAERARRVTLAAMPVSPRHDTNTFIAVSDTLRRKSTTASPSPRKVTANIINCTTLCFLISLEQHGLTGRI